MKRIALRWVCFCLLASACGGAPSVDTAEQVLGDTTCSLTTWSDPSSTSNVCSGEWKYQDWGRCTLQDPSCGCQTWRSCSSWAYGAVPSTTPGSDNFTIGKHCEPGSCDSGICTKPVCGPDVDAAEARCAQLAASHLTTIQQPVPLPWKTQVHVNADSITVGFRNWTGSYYPVTCTYTYSTFVMASQTGPQCGCAQFNQCPITSPSCGPSGVWLYSAPGLTLDQLHAQDANAAITNVPPANQPQCTSGEGVANQPAQPKYNVLLSYRADPNLAAPAAMNPIIRTQKLLYELYGADLTDAQRADARKLYDSAPDVGNDCGPVPQMPPIPASCPASVATGLGGGVRVCQRLLAGHVLPTLASREMLVCSYTLARFDDGAADQTCGGSNFRSLLGPVVTQLLGKQFETINTDPTLLGATARQLYLIDQWYDAESRTQTSVDADLAGAMRTFWRRKQDQGSVFSAVRSAVGPDGGADVQTALNTATTAGRTMDQNVLVTAFTPVGTLLPDNISVPRTPLRGVPLLSLMSDSMQSLVTQLDDFALFHDFACQFRSCVGLDTPTSRAWILIASLDNPQALGQALSGSSLTLAGWRTVFSTIQSNPSALTAALTATPSHPAPILEFIAHAKARAQRYAIDGFFDSTAHRVLHAGVDQQERQQAINFVSTHQMALDQALTNYRNQLVALTTALVGELDNNASQQRLSDLRLSKATQIDNIGQDLGGLRASADSDDAQFSNVASAYRLIEQVLDQNAFFQIGNSQSLEFSGASARWNGLATDLPSISAAQVSGLQAGQMLAIETHGRWKPTCALRQTRWLTPGGSAPTTVDTSGVDFGPEGFIVQWTGSAYQAHGHSETDHSSFDESVDIQEQVCQGTGTAAQVFGFEAKLCVSNNDRWDWGHTTQDSDSNGTEFRTTAALSGGLRLPNTPFSALPAGSLLVVLYAENLRQIVDVQVVREPYTTMLIPQNVSAYFIANDIATCTDLDNQTRLSVTTKTMTSLGAIAPLVTAAMSDVLSQVRGQQQTLVNQGRILPTQLAAIRSQATLALQTRVQVPLSSLPPALMQLFDAFVDKELVRLERAVEMSALQRQRALLRIDLSQIDDDLAAGTQKSQLLGLVPGWVLRNLQGDQLRSDTADLLMVARDYLRPILELWYPSALAQASTSQYLSTLLNTDLNASLIDAIQNTEGLLRDVMTAYGDATFGTRPPGDTLPLVAISFPKPDASNPNPFGNGTTSPWRKADAGRSKLVWDAIAARGAADLEIRTDDLYSALDGDAVISCYESDPVVKTAALYFVRPGAADSTNLNGLNRRFPSLASDNQVFADVTGPMVFQLADGAWQENDLPVLYGEADQALVTFSRAPRQMSPIGLSPFGVYEVNMAAINGLIGANGIDDATELVLVMEIDSRRVGTAATWITTCR